jgi:hypothetical protein
LCGFVDPSTHSSNWASQKPHSEESLCYSTQIHDITRKLKLRVKEKFPQIARVTIHSKLVEER